MKLLKGFASICQHIYFLKNGITQLHLPKSVVLCCRLRKRGLVLKPACSLYNKAWVTFCPNLESCFVFLTLNNSLCFSWNLCLFLHFILFCSEVTLGITRQIMCFLKCLFFASSMLLLSCDSLHSCGAASSALLILSLQRPSTWWAVTGGTTVRPLPAGTRACPTWSSIA